MAITLPTLDELKNDLRAVLKALQPNISVSIDTDEGALIESLAEAIWGLYVELRAIEADIYPQTAAEAALLLHATARLGDNPRKAATVSSGTNALRVSGTVGATVAIGDTLAHSNGTRYQIAEAGTVGGGGTVDVDVESISTGTSCNLSTGETLTFESPPVGITSDAEIVVALTGGTDTEEIEALRTRLMHAYANPPAGGRFSDYWAWAMAVTGVDQAYVYGPSSAMPVGRRGYGCVDVAILGPGSGSARTTGASAVEDDVQDAIDEEAPATAETDVIVPTPVEEDVDVQVIPKVGYEWDWELEPAETAIIASWSSPDITLTANVPQQIQDAVDAGETPRICLNGEVLTITAHGEPGAHTITIDETPVTTPASPQVCYPAGPLSEPVQEAITAVFDALGPARGYAADPEQDWEDELKVAQIYNAVWDVTGVDDCTIVTPAANVTPTDSAPVATIELLVPGQITVRPT